MNMIGEQQNEGGGFPLPSGQPNYASPMYDSSGTIMFMTNPDEELQKLQLTLRNQILNSEGVPVKIGDPLMNETGISAVLGQIQSIVNRVTIMSNLDKGEIMILMDFLGDTLAKDLMMNKESYEIKESTTRDRIYFAALTTSFVTMKRAFEEGDKRFWKGSQQEITTRLESNAMKQGLFSKIGSTLWNK